jgi:protein-disulfide isomerase
MASRKEQKEAARARRLEEERARAAAEARRRRLGIVGGGALAVVAVLAIILALGASGGSSSNGLLKGAQATALVNQTNALLSGIPQSGATLGSPSAPVTMTYFGDLQCPVCRDFTVNGGFPSLVKNEVRAGKVKVVYRAFQTATPDATTFATQQAAALAAGKQNHFWDFTELFYHQQGQEGTGYVTESYLDGIANQIAGLNVSAWRTVRNDSTLSSQVTSDELAGRTAGVQGTPTLIFHGPKGQQIAPSGVPTYGDLQQAIKAVT